MLLRIRDFSKREENALTPQYIPCMYEFNWRIEFTNKERNKEKENYVGSEALPTSIKAPNTFSIN